jgi:hypothetical protein
MRVVRRAEERACCRRRLPAAATAAFGTDLVYSARALIGPRPDRKQGCDEPDPPQVPLRSMPRPARLTSP